MKNLDQATFEIGGEDQLAAAAAAGASTGDDSEADKARRWSAFLRDAQIRIGTLLKMDTVSILLGAGASKDAGGILLGSVDRAIDSDLLRRGFVDDAPAPWLVLFYVAARLSGALEAPVEAGAIRDRRARIDAAPPLPANYERILSLLHSWRAAIPPSHDLLRIDGSPEIVVRASDLEDCIRNAKGALARRCVLPTPASAANTALVYKSLLRKLLTRPLNLKRVNIFTLNYDTLVEQAADAEGVVLLDGFVGTLQRVFRPESYDQDLYFPADTTEGRVHRFDRVVHLYKLHGSITWTTTEPDWDNPYGVLVPNPLSDADESPLIYPSPAKYGETLGMPYAELFRRFATAVVRPQSVLFVLGYGFGDDHVNAVIRHALAIPSFTIVIVDPYAPAADPAGGFVARLRAQQDRRVWVVSGEVLGCFQSFVEQILPDLHDQEIVRKVVATHRTLATVGTDSGVGGVSDGE